MPLQCEMLPDWPEAREEFLRAFRVAKAAHATLAFACWCGAQTQEAKADASRLRVRRAFFRYWNGGPHSIGIDERRAEVRLCPRLRQSKYHSLAVGDVHEA